MRNRGYRRKSAVGHPQYICRREGRLRQLEIEKEEGVEEKWRGISSEYWYLTMAGAYMRHRRISPFGLCELLVRRRKQKRRTENQKRVTKER